MVTPYTENAVLSLPDTDTENARNLGSDKETVAAYVLTVVQDGEIREAIDLRLYMGRSRNAQIVHASIWIRSANRKRYLSGFGQASGYGYCKSSAATSAALASAGVKMQSRFDGAGMSTAMVALNAVAVAMGWNLKGSRWIVNG